MNHLQCLDALAEIANDPLIKGFNFYNFKTYFPCFTLYFILHIFEITVKKTFKLTHDKIKPERQVEAVKHEIKKYIKRERKRDLDEGVDYLDFDCKFGTDETTSEVIHLAEINKLIDQAVSDAVESFYIEVIAKPGYRKPKPQE